uniref:U6 small nuclear RNA (adenine-(43)-N(6))-methyltransferase n=1 Tax=Anopheles epiroticus TaxID=199890 RepID=A0A182PKE1_9DIPT
MAVNDFMHPRNRYRQKPNFRQLVKLYPELNEVASVDISGKVKLDYRNKHAVHLLSKCLLLRDFGLKLELPPNKLVPTLPLRLNYIHWLEDIGAVARWEERKDPVRGIDIGCGASCIYPLLAVVQSNKRWHMVAIEKATDSVESAKANVIRNKLQSYINVKAQKQEGNTILLDVMQQDFPNERFDFCMCNPPFFDSSGKAMQPQDRTGRRREPSNASTGSIEELCTEGGEVTFISQIIDESVQLKDRISVYTTMIGHKKSFDTIQRVLNNASIHNTAGSRFCQGNTTRWAVAWSFDDKVSLSLVPNEQMANCKNVSPGKKKPTGKPFSHRLFELSEVESIKSVQERIVTKLRSIDIDVRTVIASNQAKEMMLELTARENTWSHQRRKRRAGITGTSPQKAEVTIMSSKNGNGTTECQEYNNDRKRPRLEGEKDEECSLTSDRTDDPYIRVALQILQKDDGYHVALQFLAGRAGKDAVNQIL